MEQEEEELDAVKSSNSSRRLRVDITALIESLEVWDPRKH
jgi:hypothetical protein